MGQAVGLGAGLNDVPRERQTVNDRSAYLDLDLEISCRTRVLCSGRVSMTMFALRFLVCADGGGRMKPSMEPNMRSA